MRFLHAFGIRVRELGAIMAADLSWQEEKVAVTGKEHSHVACAAGGGERMEFDKGTAHFEPVAILGSGQEIGGNSSKACSSRCDDTRLCQEMFLSC